METFEGLRVIVGAKEGETVTVGHVEGNSEDGDWVEGDWVEGDWVEGDWVVGDWVEGDCETSEGKVRIPRLGLR
eukprot:1380757-Amorphochlora_amoeboformis.AAC.1